MKKWLLLVVCVLLVLSLLAACQRTDTPSSNPTTITVPFPADFPMELYTAEPLTALGAFEWGQYVPFVQCNGQSYRQHMDYFDAGFITGECTSLRDACLLYDKLNDLYLTQSAVIDVKFENTDYSLPVTQAPYTILDRPMYVDMLFRSHIVSLSPDLQRIGKVTFSFQGDDQTAFLNQAEWWQDQYEIYQNDVLVQSHQQPNKANEYEEYFTYNSYEDYFKVRLSGAVDSIPLYMEVQGKRSLLTAANEQLAVYCDFPAHYRVYSVKDMELLYDITFEDERSEAGSRTIEIEQVVQDRYLLLSVSSGTTDPFTYFDCAYLYDLKTDTMTCLEDYAYEPSLSPDGKYLAYTAPLGEDVGIQNGQEIPMEKGFYIKNLQDNTTVFFADSNGYIAGWVDDQILMQKIGS